MGEGGHFAREQQVQRLGDVTSARLRHSPGPPRGQQQLWLLSPVFKRSELPEARVLGMEGTRIISTKCWIKPESCGQALGARNTLGIGPMWANSKINALPRVLTPCSQKREGTHIHSSVPASWWLSPLGAGEEERHRQTTLPWS